MSFAFVKIWQDPETGRWTPKFTVNTDAPQGMHWARFGINVKGWDVVWTNIPLSYFTADPADYHLVDTDRLSLTISEIPIAKRQEMNTWLTNHGYDTSWITASTTVKEVLKDILHWLNNRQDTPDRLISWCLQYMVD